MTTEPGEGTPMSSPQEPAVPPTPGAAEATGPAEATGATGAAEASGAADGSGESTAELLQSMLSRAVEGQLGDQRELTGAVTDMRNQLMRLSQELAELRVRPPVDDGADAQINTVTVEMREAVRFLSERLDGVTRMVAQRGEELADIRTALTAIDAHVRSQAETIGVLSAGLQALPSYGERVSVLQDNLQVLHRQLVGIEESVGKSEDNHVEERLMSIESTLTPLGDRLNEIGDLGTAHSALLSQLQSSSSQVQQAVSGVHESVSGVAASVSGVHESVSGVAASVSGVRESVSDVAESVSGVQQSVVGVHDRIEPLASAPAAPAVDPELDSKITASVAGAVRDTEQRLMAHVDEAVMALAEMLLRRRAPTVASQITGTPVPATAPPVTPQPVAEVPAAQVPDVVAAPVEVAPEATAEAPAEAAGEASGEWWERDIQPADSTPLEAAAAQAADAEPAESEGHDIEADATDATDATDSTDATPVSEPLAAPDASGDELAPSGPPVEADDAAVTGAFSELPPPSPETVVAPPAPWLPDTPPERDPADPTVSFEDGKKKRRWGRGK